MSRSRSSSVQEREPVYSAVQMPSEKSFVTGRQPVSLRNVVKVRACAQPANPRAGARARAHAIDRR